MRLIDPHSKKESNNVAIFSLGEQRMFLPITEVYQVSSGLNIVVVFMYLVVIQGNAQTDC
jgi:hypothetical protein